MTAYRVLIRVAHELKLAELLTNVDVGEIVSITPEKSAIPTKKNMRYVEGKRLKGINGVDLLKELFKKKKTRNTTELKDAFEANGFSENSMSPRLSGFLKEGLIERLSDGVYRWR